MSYQLNKTDGSLLTELIDGQIDQSSTNLTLFGKNFTGYGEHLNENFIKLLENFSNTAAPSNPLTGQLWWDLSEQRMKVYDGNRWKTSGGPYIQPQRPEMVAGDFWINNQSNQVYAYDGTDDILVGPIYSDIQGKSGFEISSIIDTQSRGRTVVKLHVGGVLVAVISNVQFTPQPGNEITELVNSNNPNGIIYQGFNIVDTDNFIYRSTSSSSLGLIDNDGNEIQAEQLLRSNGNNISTGTLTIQNNGGITIGASSNTVHKIVANDYYIENQIENQDMHMRVRSGAYSGLIVDALYIDSENARVGIFTTDRTPEYTLDVDGDLRVTGTLFIEGETSEVSVSTLNVADKVIELAISSDSTIGNDTLANDGGIILRSSDGDKTILWKSSTNSWSFNKSIDLTSVSSSLKINGDTKLTGNALVNITQAVDLVEIGTLEYLNVDNININSNTITNNTSKLVINSTVAGIDINSNGDIAINNQKITGVVNPTSNQDVATKSYVDSAVVTENIALSMDISGLTNPNPHNVGDGPITDVANYLNLLYPATASNNGKTAKILAVSYSGSTVSGISVTVRDVTDPNNGETLTVSKIPVDANGTLNESVVQDITDTNTASGTVTLTPSRYIMTFASNGTSWIHSSTIPA